MSISEDDPRYAQLVEAARRRRIDRRRFMEGALYTGASAAAASSLWGTRVQARVPKRGGTFRVGIHDGHATDSLDPATWRSVQQIQIGCCVYSYLTRIEPDMGLGPDLATEWSSNAEATEWTFRLDPRATFHDGRGVRAVDVIASMNHHQGARSTSGARAILQEVAEIEARGEDAVVFRMSTGVADLPFLLADHHLAIHRADEDGTIDWRSGVGSGPYRFVHHDPGVRSEFVRHDGWHGADDGAWFDAVTMVTLNDAKDRQIALMTNQVDAVTSVDLKTYGMLRRAPGVRTFTRPSGSFLAIAGGGPGLFHDAARALKFAIDREEIVEKIFLNNAAVGNDTPLGGGHPAAGGLAQIARDPDRAAFHLRATGLERLDVALRAPQTVASDIAEITALLARQAQSAGIAIRLQSPTPGRSADDGTTLDLVQWGARPTADGIFSLAYRSGAPWNRAGWSHERFDALLLQAKAETDAGLRAEIHAEMGRILQDEAPVAIPVFPDRIAAMRDNVMFGDDIAVNWELDGGRAYQRWWFA